MNAWVPLPFMPLSRDVAACRSRAPGRAVSWPMVTSKALTHPGATAASKVSRQKTVRQGCDAALSSTRRRQAGTTPVSLARKAPVLPGQPPAGIRCIACCGPPQHGFPSDRKERCFLRERERPRQAERALPRSSSAGLYSQQPGSHLPACMSIHPQHLFDPLLARMMLSQIALLSHRLP